MFTISRLVNRLVLNGYITKEQALTDRCNYFLYLTKEGQANLSAIKDYSFERISSKDNYLKEHQVKSLLNLADQLPVILGVTEAVFAAQPRYRSKLPF